MKNLKYGLILLIGMCLPIYSHFYWVIAKNYSPKLKETIYIEVSGGHNFPKPGFLISKTIIFKSRIINQEKTTNFVLNKSNKQWIGKTNFDINSMSFIEIVLKKKYDKEPRYYARAILLPQKDKQLNMTLFTIGKGLEIIPQKNLLLIKKNDSCKFQIMMDNKPIKTTVRVIRTKNDSTLIGTDKSGIITYKFIKSGRYIFTTKNQRIGASLTFSIPNTNFIFKK
jgi:hypothetical protein